MVLVLKFWKPPTIMRLEGDKEATLTTKKHPGREVFVAWLPYLLLVVFVLTWGEASIKAVLDRFTNGLLPGFLPLNPNVLNGHQRAGPAQHDHAHPAGHAGAGAIRRRLHA